VAHNIAGRPSWATNESIDKDAFMCAPRSSERRAWRASSPSVLAGTSIIGNAKAPPGGPGGVVQGVRLSRGSVGGRETR
jgi:hypothetical protein